MLKQIEIMQKPRLAMFKLIDELSIEQINLVPPGFNNNIVWNLAHVIAAQQGVCYLRAGVDMVIDQEFYDSYKPESKPGQFVDEAGLEYIKQLSASTLNQLEIDLSTDLFANYKPWTTRYGVPLNNIDEAISFLPFHEGLHVGYIMALRRVVINL